MATKTSSKGTTAKASAKPAAKTFGLAVSKSTTLRVQRSEFKDMRGIDAGKWVAKKDGTEFRLKGLWMREAEAAFVAEAFQSMAGDQSAAPRELMLTEATKIVVRWSEWDGKHGLDARKCFTTQAAPGIWNFTDKGLWLSGEQAAFVGAAICDLLAA